MRHWVTTTSYMRALSSMALLGWLAACVPNQLLNESRVDISAGRLESGLAKLDEAARRDPTSAFLKSEQTMVRRTITQQLLRQAEAAGKTAHFTEARALYQRVLGIDQDNTEAKTGLDLVDQGQKHEAEIRTAKSLLSRHEITEARAQLARILSVDPYNVEAKNMLAQIISQTPPAPPARPKLRTKQERVVALEFRESPLSMVFEALSRTTGINFVLDKDVKSDAKTTIFVKDMPIETVLDMVLAQHALEKKLLTDNSVFIFPDTPDKRRRHEEQVVKSFHLLNADPKQAMNLLKVMLETKSLFVDDHAKLLVMRDTPEVVHMAEKLLVSLDLEDSEVMMEVEIVEISRSKLQDLGVKYPNQINMAALPPPAGSATGGSAAIMKLADLLTLNKTDRWSVSNLNATIDLKREDAESNLLASPRIRARNYEKAKVLIGDRVPVITNAVTPTNVGSSVVTGSVQYIDVGLKFEVEPTIYRDDEVAMKVNLEVSNIVKEVQNSVSGTLAYQIGTRTASTVLRLQHGETQILAGLISDEDRETAAKVPGLSNLPVLGRLFTSQKSDIRKTEIVLSITPYIIRHGERPSLATSEIWYGTETLRGVPSLFQTGRDDRASLSAPKGLLPAAAVQPADSSHPKDAHAIRGTAGHEVASAAPSTKPELAQPSRDTGAVRSLSTPLSIGSTGDPGENTP